MQGFLLPKISSLLLPLARITVKYFITKFRVEKTVTELLEKPYPPAQGECCESGSCNPCVWDHYYAELQKWRIQQAKLKEKKQES